MVHCICRADVLKKPSWAWMIKSAAAVRLVGMPFCFKSLSPIAPVITEESLSKAPQARREWRSARSKMLCLTLFPHSPSADKAFPHWCEMVMWEGDSLAPDIFNAFPRPVFPSCSVK